MIFDNSPIDLEEFLRDYWQQKPCLIRSAFPGFEPDLDADDIAGLACDELAESRLITGSFPAHDWCLRYGPFAESDFVSLPQDNWTLLVQDVDKHYPPLKKFLDHFDFIPGWRIDDLMVSVAAPGGSVGPHVDQYDVFLFQAAGKRKWQVAEKYESELLSDCDLNVLLDFWPEQEWSLEAGDMLYLPPGIAHHGTAVETCMTWSVGMRAPSEADVLQSLGEWLAASRSEGARYRDPPLALTSRPGEVDAQAVDRFRQLASSSAKGQEFVEFLGVFLSRYRLAHEPAPPESGVDPDQLMESLQAGQALKQNPWTRLLWLASGSDALLFAAGSAYRCDPELAIRICDPSRLERIRQPGGEAEISLLCKLVNDGHLYLEDRS